MYFWEMTSFYICIKITECPLEYRHVKCVAIIENTVFTWYNKKTEY